MTIIEELNKASQEAAAAGLEMLKKSQMALDFSAHDHHKAYTRMNDRGTVSNVKAKGMKHDKIKETPAFKIREVEVSRSNVTVAEFFASIKGACAKKGMDFGLERDFFENPSQSSNDSYYVKDGIKYARYGDGEPTREYDGSDAPAKAETSRMKPYDYQTYILNHDGSAFNETCEFTFDSDKKGSGYYYQINKDADEAPATPAIEAPTKILVREWLKASGAKLDHINDHTSEEKQTPAYKRELKRLTDTESHLENKLSAIAQKTTDAEWNAATPGTDTSRQDFLPTNHHSTPQA